MDAFHYLEILIKAATEGDWQTCTMKLLAECSVSGRDGDRHPVVIPFAPSLADQLDPSDLRIRRDCNTICKAIMGQARLNHLLRKRTPSGNLIATIEDYDAVRPWLAKLLPYIDLPLPETLDATE